MSFVSSSIVTLTRDATNDHAIRQEHRMSRNDQLITAEQLASRLGAPDFRILSLWTSRDVAPIAALKHHPPALVDAFGLTCFRQFAGGMRTDRFGGLGQ
jgi:hypothetical protein